MRLAAPYNWAADFGCPHCGTPLNVEDPEDFVGRDAPMEREEVHWGECPSCGGEFEFHVTWEPTYPYEPTPIGGEDEG